MGIDMFLFVSCCPCAVSQGQGDCREGGEIRPLQIGDTIPEAQVNNPASGRTTLEPVGEVEIVSTGYQQIDNNLVENAILPVVHRADTQKPSTRLSLIRPC